MDKRVIKPKCIICKKELKEAIGWKYNFCKFN